jgi:hypothetical protein
MQWVVNQQEQTLNYPYSPNTYPSFNALRYQHNLE